MPKPVSAKRANVPAGKTFSRMLIDEPPLMFSPTLARAVGVNEAIVVQQVHYWLTNFRQNPKQVGHFQDGRWWVWNSYPEWREGNFPFWSEDTVVRCFRSLEKRGVVLSRQASPNPYDRTKSYSIDYERLDALLDELEGGDGTPPLTPPSPSPEPPVRDESDPDAVPMTATCGDGTQQSAAINLGNLRSSLHRLHQKTTPEKAAPPLSPAAEDQEIIADTSDTLWDAIPSASEEDRQEKPPKGRTKDAIERALYWVCNPSRDPDIEASLYGLVRRYGKDIREHGTVTAEQILEQFGPGGPYYSTILAGDDPARPRLPSPIVVYNWAFRLGNLARATPKPKPGDPPILPSDEEMRQAAELARQRRAARSGQTAVLGMIDDLLIGPAGVA